MRERTVIAAIQRWIKTWPVPARVRKLADRFTRGYPDLQVIFRWEGELILLEVECKSPRGKESALQAAEAEMMQKSVTSMTTRNRGQYIRIREARSVADVKAAMKERGIDLDLE